MKIVYNCVGTVSVPNTDNEPVKTDKTKIIEVAWQWKPRHHLKRKKNPCAFNNCGALEFFIVAEDNLYYTSINGHLILKDNLELIKGVNNAIIPDGITKIHQAAFRRINNLETLTIPLSVKEIDNYIISDSTITTINYLGTETMWNEIVKGNLWNLGKEDISINYINN